MNKVFLFALIAMSNLMNAQEEPISAFLEKWENSKNYLVEIAEAMPDTAYDYKPTEREMTFSKQLQHIQKNMVWLGSEYFNGESADIKDLKNNKEKTIESIKNSFDIVALAVKSTSPSDLKESVEFFAGPKTKLQILNLLQDHVTHHRGQLIVYLNLNDIKPPRYTGW